VLFEERADPVEHGANQVLAARKRFADSILAPGVPICNDLIKQADEVIDNFTPFGEINPSFDPRTRRESPVWANFDVRR
jgi:hypothetical protein